MKVDFITIHPDNTASIKKCKTKGTKVMVSRHWKPEFSEGRAVYPLTTKHFFGLLKRRKRIMIAIEGNKRCYELSKNDTKLGGSAWNMRELVDYVGKLVHLSLATAKPFSNMQAFFLFGLMAANTVMILLMLRRIGF